MEIKVASTDDFKKIWKQNFLGQQGFFIPGTREFTLGMKTDLTFSIGKDICGKALLLPVWSNRHGPRNQDLPRGTFLTIIRMDPDLHRLIC
ncbi:hypothetical protein [Desulfonatronovibrio hydrogenovorans]|uniref:hypothetical protein n=1 Tax=Desulfonatronovibrio hydrogenovorans TaxID=53245 RepID=UPI000490B106|nr:hypothetical protein [Desulfonatronovibrio hydrogenovorans]